MMSNRFKRNFLFLGVFSIVNPPVIVILVETVVIFCYDIVKL